MNWLRRSNAKEEKKEDSEKKPEGSPKSDEKFSQDENNIYDDGEVLAGEPKNLILAIISQLRPGMDLSRVTLPVFILETKSFLEKLTDFMTHPDLLIGLKLETPEERIKAITRFYMSGFYIRPKGVKKPYTPQLGETFRCHWNHTESKSFYVSEQVSHNPDISAFYGSNRAEGFVVNGSITFRDKFLGNSTSVTLEGEGRLHLLNYDEVYTFTFPVVYARGLLWGTLAMELGGEIYVKCDKSGYRSDIEFKVKGFFGGESNLIAGKISKGTVDDDGRWDKKLQTLYTFDGKWDGQINIKDTRTKEETVYWDPEAGMAPKSKMIVRPLEEQSEWDSRRFWHQVTLALRANDTEKATDEKLRIDAMMKQLEDERTEKDVEYEPKLFEKNEEGAWVYKHFDLTRWSEKEIAELEEYEEDGIIASRPKASKEEKAEKKKKKKKKSKKEKTEGGDV